MATRRINDIIVLYDSDNGNQRLFPQRLYIDSTTGVTLTPVTNLLTARIVTTDTKIENPKDLTKRKALTYVVNPNVSDGISRMNVILPYAPGDVRLANHLREIGAIPTTICSDYFGELSRDWG